MFPFIAVYTTTEIKISSWGAQAKMTRLKSKILEIPTSAHGILEFAFFCGVGFTAGSLGLI